MADFFQHETAIIDKGAQIGSDCRIWHWVHICSKAKIGKNCSFGQGVFVGNDVSIGDNCKIQNNVSIYDRVHLEEDVFCGPSMVFTNVINPRSAIERKSEYLPTLCRKGSTIGANATIVCGIELGEYCFVAAGAVVHKNVPPYALMAGVPAKQKGWMCSCGVQLKGEGEVTCPSCNKKYEITSSSCKPI